MLITYIPARATHREIHNTQPNQSRQSNQCEALARGHSTNTNMTNVNLMTIKYRRGLMTW